MAVESGLGTDAFGDLKNVNLAQEADVKLTDMWGTIVSVLKTMIGVGILGLPFAFKAGGWLFSIFVFPILAVLTVYCMTALIRAKDAAHLTRTAAPADIGQAGFGTPGKIIVAVVLVLDAIGICISYFIFITYNMKMLTGVRQEIWAVVFFALFFICSYIHPLRSISFLTLGANILMLIGVVITLIAVFVASTPAGKPHLFNWKEFPIFLGILLSAFQAIEMALPAHNMLRNQKRFPLAISIVLVIACLAYLLFGLIVYLRLADNSLSMITETIEVFSVQITIAIIFIVALCTNLICWIFPIYEIADRLSCANKYRIISAKERARILAENEGHLLKTNANVNPNPDSTSSSTTPTANAKSNATTHVVPAEYESNPASTPSPSDPSSVASSDAGLEAAPEEDAHALSAEVKQPPLSPPSSSSCPSSSSDPMKVVPTDSDAASASTSSNSSADSGSGAQSPSDANAVDEDNPGCLRSVLINWKYWTLSTVGRAVTLLIIMAPCLTPIRDHFTGFFGLVGSTTGVLMAFVLPMCAQLRIQWRSLPLWQRILDIVIITLAIPGMVYVTVIQLISLIDSLKAGEA